MTAVKLSVMVGGSIVEVKMDYLTAWDLMKLFFLSGDLQLTLLLFMLLQQTNLPPVEAEIIGHCVNMMVIRR